VLRHSRYKFVNILLVKTVGVSAILDSSDVGENNLGEGVYRAGDVVEICSRFGAPICRHAICAP
jgi:hypothetical protein